MPRPRKKCDHFGHIFRSSNFPNGIRFKTEALMVFNADSSIPALFNISVSVGPGLTALTLILRGASSNAAMRITEFNAALLDE
jgi:hypothetical protein